MNILEAANRLAKKGKLSTKEWQAVAAVSLGDDVLAVRSGRLLGVRLVQKPLRYRTLARKSAFGASPRPTRTMSKIPALVHQ